MAYTINPHLPRVRMQAVRLVRHRNWSIRQAARYTGVAPGTISRWLKKDHWWGWRPIPTLSSRPHHHPGVLKPEIIEAIVRQRKKHRRCAQVVHQELLNQGVKISLSSVKRTLKRHGLLRERSPWKKWHWSLSRPEVKKAGDLVQIDTIHIGPADNQRFYVYTLIDVASRWSFAAANERINTHQSLKFVKLARRLAPFDFKTIQTDHGQEFSSYFTERLKISGIAHRHSRVRQANDNGHLERFNRTIQEECLERITRTKAAYQKAIEKYLPYYNNERLHLGLNLKTPLQVLRSY